MLEYEINKDTSKKIDIIRGISIILILFIHSYNGEIRSIYFNRNH